MINVEMTKAAGVTLATENTICNDNVNVTIAHSENLIAENIKKDVQIADVVGTLESSGGDNSALIDLIQRDLTDITIPDSVTIIGGYAFKNCTNLKSITIPDSVTSIGYYAFSGCTNLKSITIPDSVTSVNRNAFDCCTSLASITIPDSVTIIGGYAFNNCTSLTSITIPNNIGGSTLLIGCSSLENVTIKNNFNANNLDLSASTKYTRETIVSWLNALADRTGQTAYKLTIGSTNLAKLTSEDIAIATSKNWTLA